MKKSVKGWDRGLRVPFVYDSVTEIPDNGTGAQYVAHQCDLAARDTKSRYDTGDTSPKPGTLIDVLAATAAYDIMRKYNPNGIGGGDMFRGCFRREKDVICMLARMMGKSKDDHFLDAGFLLNGGTESLNQALLMYRNKFFSDTLGENVRVQGVARALVNHLQKHKKSHMIQPRILAPVNYHFSVARAAELLGLGINSIAYYGLDETFDIDRKHLRSVISDIYAKGDYVMAALVCGGDTTHGKVHDPAVVNNLLQEMSVKYEVEVPPIIVDCAGTYQFIGLMKDSKQYSGKLPRVGFEVPGVSAIYGDLHKQEMPYGSSVLLLRDYSTLPFADLRDISSVPYLDHAPTVPREGKIISQEDAQIFCPIPVSRSGANVFAAWAYYVGNGTTELRRRKEAIWNLVRSFTSYIKESAHYELVVEPQTQTVAFSLKNISGNRAETGRLNQWIYEQIKNSREDALHISQDDTLLVRTPEDLARSAKCSEFRGLFATFMEHNSQEGIQKLEDRLDELATQTSLGKLTTQTQEAQHAV